jgi:hypothetical protein
VGREAVTGVVERALHESTSNLMQSGVRPMPGILCSIPCEMMVVFGISNDIIVARSLQQCLVVTRYPQVHEQALGFMWSRAK